MKKPKMKITISKNRQTNEVRNDDDNNDKTDSGWWKSLARGVISEMEMDGVIEKGLFQDDDFEEPSEEVIQEFEVGCDDEELYERAEFAKELDMPIIMHDYITGGFTANTGLCDVATCIFSCKFTVIKGWARGAPRLRLMFYCY